MHRLVASTPQTKVLGISMLTLINTVNADEIRPILMQHGLNPTNVKPTDWLPHQQMLDIYRSIEAKDSNVSENYVSIGMKIMEQAPFPPELKTVEEALASLGPTYEAAHRNNTEAGWITEFKGEGHALITADNPYPDDLCYGLLWALVRRFVPKGHGFTVKPLPLSSPEGPVQYEVTW
jgi:hypothetical protein